MRPSVLAKTRAAKAKGTSQIYTGGAGFTKQKAKHKEKGGARGSSRAALSETQKKQLKKRQRSRQVRDGHVSIDWWEEDLKFNAQDVFGERSVYHQTEGQKKNVKKRQRSREVHDGLVHDGHVGIDYWDRELRELNPAAWFGERSDGLLNVYAGPSVYHSHATVKIGAWSGKALSEGQEIKMYGPAEMDDSGEWFGWWRRISPFHESPAWIMQKDIRGYSRYWLPCEYR